MEFLDINLKKMLESFAPCYSQSLLSADLKKPLLVSGFKNPYKKICEPKILKSIHEQNFVEGKNKGRKPEKTSSLRRLEFMPRNLD
jgi:hypothetical protein